MSGPILCESCGAPRPLDELHADKRFNVLFAQRFDALYRDPDLRKVVDLFGIEAFRRSSVIECFDQVVREVGFHGKTCVEIGTCKGLTAVILSRYFDQVVSIDILPDPLKHRIVNELGITNIRFVDVANNAEKARVIEALDFDACYQDGDHAHDTELDFALVHRCGRVLFHEYWPAQPAVVQLVNSLKGRVQHHGKFALWTR